MELRTRLNIDQSPFKISYSDGVIFTGSCFASSIGLRMEAGRMPVIINPTGTVYNPVSVLNTINNIISGKKFNKDDLFLHKGTWLSFSHYTDFSSSDPETVTNKINQKLKEALDFMNRARFLFITFGTARVYRLKKTGEIVSNCHKIPAELFQTELLRVNDIVSQWSCQLDTLNKLFPQVKVIFTISPVRHWKDGAHGNQISKSVLFLAVEELLAHRISPQYFPAYEILMDDLRDYRFYDDDMLHPSEMAINYIWEAFSNCYMDKKTLNTWREASIIIKAVNHRLKTDSPLKIKDFAERILKKISDLEAEVPEIVLTSEKEYFLNMIKSYH